MEAAGAVDAKNAPTAPCKTRRRVSHSYHSPLPGDLQSTSVTHVPGPLRQDSCRVSLGFGTVGRGSDNDVTRPFSLAYKQKMLDRLTGKDAVSARQLSLETGLRQQTLSRWLQDACSLSMMPSKRQAREWSIDEKIRIL